jgi:CheY-specific phosphatase CheX
MDQEKFKYYCTCIENALERFLSTYEGFTFTRKNEAEPSSEKKLSAIVRVVGQSKGRVHIEMSEVLTKKLYEHANGEPEEDEMDLCFYLAEFTNIVAGNGVTFLNDAYKGSDFRLTPPAIFAGDNLDISTPKVLSSTLIYGTEFGTLRVEVGFEGM